MWSEAQGKLRADIMAHVRSFDLVGLHLAKPRIGYGIERALYALNSSWPCQSPLLAADYVAGLDDLLPALERLAAQGKTERSEEHTSELQSLMRNSYAVFCLKKKKYDKTK